MPGRIDSLDNVADQVRHLQVSGKRIVFTNGCFDILHAGHVDLLQRARALGDVLVVAKDSAPNGDTVVTMPCGCDRLLLASL